MNFFICDEECLFTGVRKTLLPFHWQNCKLSGIEKNVFCSFVDTKNDYCLQLKCGHHKKVVWPWLVEQIQPTLTELGVRPPEALGYDKPELYLKKTEEF